MVMRVADGGESSARNGGRKRPKPTSLDSGPEQRQDADRGAQENMQQQVGDIECGSCGESPQ
jgi:hypothetical protein